MNTISCLTLQNFTRRSFQHETKVTNEVELKSWREIKQKGIRNYNYRIPIGAQFESLLEATVIVGEARGRVAKTNNLISINLHAQQQQVDGK
jgi:hypothetical protein